MRLPSGREVSGLPRTHVLARASGACKLLCEACGCAMAELVAFLVTQLRVSPFVAADDDVNTPLHCAVAGGSQAACRTLLGDAYGRGYGDGTMVTLGAAPEAVNVVVGGTRDAPRLWHEVPLDDLSGLLPSEYTAGEQIVPLLVSSNREEAECYSAYAAQQGLAQKVGVKMHQYGLAFALSNFKLPKKP